MSFHTLLRRLRRNAEPPRGSLDASDLDLKLVQNYDDQKRRGFRPRSDCEPWPLTVPIDWASGPEGDRNWMSKLHSWRMMDPIIAAYLERPNRALLREILNIACDWYRWVKEQGNDYKWGDSATAVRAARLGFLVEQIDIGALTVPEGKRRIVERLVKQHAVRLMREKFISTSNHGVIQINGLKTFAKACGERPALRGVQNHIAKMTVKIARSQFSEEGVHREHSPAYHLFTVNLFDRLEVPEEATALLESAKTLSPWLGFPDGRVSGIGDSSRINAQQFEAFGRTIGDFTRSGYAIARDKDWMIFATGMCNSLSHKQADELSFELWDGDRFIFVDTGKYGYSDDEWRAYARSAAAHNTVSVLEREIARGDVEMVGSCLSGIRQDEDEIVIEGEVNRPDLFRQRRVLSYTPGEVLTIRDDLSSDREWTYVSSLHLAPDLTPHVTEYGFTVDLGDGRRLHAEVDADEVRFARGQTDPIRGWVTESYLKMEPTTTVMALCRGRNRTITWNVAIEAMDAASQNEKGYAKA